MCGFCNVWVCVCVGFVMCGCVYVWVPSVADIRNVWSYMPSPPFAFMTCSETKCAKFIAL